MWLWLGRLIILGNIIFWILYLHVINFRLKFSRTLDRLWGRGFNIEILNKINRRFEGVLRSTRSQYMCFPLATSSTFINKNLQPFLTYLWYEFCKKPFLSGVFIAWRVPVPFIPLAPVLMGYQKYRKCVTGCGTNKRTSVSVQVITLQNGKRPISRVPYLLVLYSSVG